MQGFFAFLTAFVILAAPFPAASDDLTVVFLGDFLPAHNADEFIQSKGYGYLFDGVRPYLLEADAIFLNLEVPLSSRGGAVMGKTYTFRGSPKAAEALRADKVLAVHLANNHILDFGPEALFDTLSALDAAGVGHAGAGIDAKSAFAPAAISLGQTTLTFLSFSNTFPEDFWAKKDRPGTAFGSPSSVERAVRRASESSDGPVVASFHWGEEKLVKPKDYQRELARLAIDAGADLVVGHHPHVPQDIEVYRGVPIIYSLGNFAFGTYSPNAAGLLAIARFGEDGRCTAVQVVPLDVVNTRVLFSPRPITGLDGQRIFDPLVMGISRQTEADRFWDGERGNIVPIFPPEGASFSGKIGTPSNLEGTPSTGTFPSTTDTGRTTPSQQ